MAGRSNRTGLLEGLLHGTEVVAHVVVDYNVRIESKHLKIRQKVGYLKTNQKIDEPFKS